MQSALAQLIPHTVGAGLLANLPCQSPQMPLTHRIRQQAGSHRFASILHDVDNLRPL